MADVDDTLPEWSSTTASNKPLGATTIGTGLDDNLREIQGVTVRWLSHKGADIASGATTDLGAVEGLMHDITGTTTITSFGTVRAGIWKIIKFEGALTLTHNATSLILPGAENITTADGDIATFISEGSGNWRCVSYVPAAINPSKTVSTDETQTLTNKTLTAPSITTMTYAGTALSNAVTGTGSMVLSVAPQITGTAKVGDAGARTTGVFATDLASSAGIEFDTGYAVLRGWGANGSTVAGMKLRISASDGSGTLYPITIAPTGGLTLSHSLARTVVTETTSARTVATTDTHIIVNYAGTCTLTLPAAATFPGREITVRTITANGVVSASANVVPLAGGAAATDILGGAAGRYATLVSNGTNWQIQSGNP